MKESYAEVLESYLIPANESDTKSALIDMAFMASVCAAIGISASLQKRKQEKAYAKKQKEDLEKIKSSPYYSQDCKYVSNKYGVTYPDDYSKETLAERVRDSITKDLKKMANAVNRNKKLCNELADEYINDAKNHEYYREEYEEDAAEIRKGVACGEYFEDGCFQICEASQNVRIWICANYLFSHFCDAINEKYAREIRLGIMGKMHDTGDGDEGLVAVNING